MKKIRIEWKHYAKEGETCTRCNNTGDNIKIAVKELIKKYKDIKFDYVETELDAEKMPESNSILINNVLIENVLGLSASENHCHSCTCLAGSDTNCKTIVSQSQTYEEVPSEFIVLAIEKVLTHDLG